MQWVGLGGATDVSSEAVESPSERGRLYLPSRCDNMLHSAGNKEPSQQWTKPVESFDVDYFSFKFFRVFSVSTRCPFLSDAAGNWPLTMSQKDNLNSRSQQQPRRQGGESDQISGSILTPGFTDFLFEYNL